MVYKLIKYFAFESHPNPVVSYYTTEISAGLTAILTPHCFSFTLRRWD